MDFCEKGAQGHSHFSILQVSLVTSLRGFAWSQQSHEAMVTIFHSFGSRPLLSTLVARELSQSLPAETHVLGLSPCWPLVSSQGARVMTFTSLLVNKLTSRLPPCCCTPNNRQVLKTRTARRQQRQ